MQRLFFMFPHGLPGVALLLLRLAVAIALLLDNLGHGQHLPGSVQATAILI